MTSKLHLWHDGMQSLKSQLDQITSTVPRRSRVWYLDYPVHGNIGDILIMFGTEKFFDDNGIRVERRYSLYDFPYGERIPSDRIIVMHGGGNLGDLYPQHQNFREHIVSTYSESRIVILPQTVHFQASNAINRAIDAMSTHRDLHIYLRDARSLAFVQHALPNAHAALCPDMAHQLWPTLYCERGTGSGQTLYLLRSDSERRAADPHLPLHTTPMDWPDLLHRFDRRIMKLFRRIMKAKRKLGLSIPISNLWYIYARSLVDRAIRLYKPYDHVVTSRLHGHILACLMGKPNTLLDNSYGKNASYVAAWTHRLPLVEYLGDTVNNVVTQRE